MSLVFWPLKRRGPTAGDSGPSQRPRRVPRFRTRSGASEERSLTYSSRLADDLPSRGDRKEIARVEPRARRRDSRTAARSIELHERDPRRGVTYIADACSHADQLSPPFLDFGRAGGRFETPDECPKLQCKQPVFRTGVADDVQEVFGADQNRLGLAMDGQNKSGTGFFECLKHLGKISVKRATTNEANARLRHRFLGAKIGPEREQLEANRQEPPHDTMGIDKISQLVAWRQRLSSWNWLRQSARQGVRVFRHLHPSAAGFGAGSRGARFAGCSRFGLRPSAVCSAFLSLGLALRSSAPTRASRLCRWRSGCGRRVSFPADRGRLCSQVAGKYPRGPCTCRIVP